ncbi:M15 family metallopeptidase [Arsenicicoccus dermatophilus]|uniref:M15 family metallopeptidase n=1 Tax=Arsenicicoccus dermatophilus TaxID=1076331 RepID=UPI001F4CC3EC|nr:M15 family metallopeptidase [Arsenicicoccus dermatophilus]MCH8611528.1 M15 family metallopeptidase [Arsenicicoccus dermatophilus]
MATLLAWALLTPAGAALADPDAHTDGRVAASTTRPAAGAAATTADPAPPAATSVPDPVRSAETSTDPIQGEPPSGIRTSTGTAPVDPTSSATLSPRRPVGQALRLQVGCESCSWPFSWVAGVGRTRLTGLTLPSRPGATVTIRRLLPGQTAWSNVGYVAADGLGRFAWVGPMTPPGTVTYQATMAAGGTSPVERRTVVNPAVTLAVPATLDTLLDPRLSGVVAPRFPGIPVRTEVLVGGVWRSAATRASASGGAWAMPLAYGRGVAGSFTVRAAITLPGGRVVASPARVVRRAAVLRPVVRGTVRSDVPVTYRTGCPVGPSRLSTIDMNHWGFDGRVHRGRLVIRTGNVTPILRAFQVAFDGRFPIREMRDASVYGGNDVISMEHDNTNAFNCRRVTGNPYRMSPHTYGTSIDINTVENPYRIPSGVWLPRNGAAYVARSPYRAGMLTPGHPFTRALQGNGFTWLSGFDWQHFQR